MDIGTSPPSPHNTLDPTSAAPSSPPQAAPTGQSLEPAVSSANAASPRVPSQHGETKLDLGSPQVMASTGRASPVRNASHVVAVLATEKLRQIDQLSMQIDASYRRGCQDRSDAEIDAEIAAMREAREGIRDFYSDLCKLIWTTESREEQGELIKIAEGCRLRMMKYLVLPSYESPDATAPSAPRTLH